MVNEMWLVIHIPKTAGTSLRWALEKQFGKSQIIRDYGASPTNTSDIVRKYIYEESQSSGPAELIKEMTDRGSKVLMGHVPLQKYAAYFEPENIITFVRDPLIRICSEYLHKTRHASFSKSFSDYLQKPGIQNQQSGLLEGASAEMVVGITNQYRASIKLINSTFDWKLKTLKKNVAKSKGGQRFAENLSKPELDVFYELNKKDMSLYQMAEQSFTKYRKAGLGGDFK